MDKEMPGCVVAFIFMLLAFCCGFGLGEIFGAGRIKTQAIKNGVAKYIVDEETGVTTFKWKSEK